MTHAEHEFDDEPQPARALWVTGPGRAELRSETLPRLGPGQVRVRSLFGAISRGTESLVFHGRVPPSEFERMRAPHQAGDLPGPVKYGYCNVGEVEAGPEALRGRAVFCLYPHQTRYVVPADAVVPVPAEVPAARAVLAANMETAINGVWDAQLSVGDRVCVVGAGVVGCLVAYLARQIAGCEVRLVDVDPRKQAVATHLGLPLDHPDHAPGEADCVIEASGAPAGLRRGLELAGAHARVVVLSWFGDQAVELPLGGAFHARRLQILSSQVGSLPAARQARWTHRRRMELALRLLADDALDALFTAQTAFERLPQALAEATEPGRFVLCHRVEYG